MFYRPTLQANQFPDSSVGFSSVIPVFSVAKCFSLAINAVIPAQAGIQLIKIFPRSGAPSWLCPLREMFVLLDSGLRRNDEFQV
jgi:hypothetical protein